MSFLIIGALGFLWMGFWVFMYKKPEVHPLVNKTELAYIQQDSDRENDPDVSQTDNKKMSFRESFRYKQTWAFAFGKFMTDGVWWFYLFWTPAYLSDVYGLTSDSLMAQVLLFVLYAITLLSIVGGWLPTFFVNKKGMHPYAGRMRSMLIFAFIPLLALLAQPLGYVSYWFPVLIIGIAGAAHQAWSANIFSTVGDMFPKSAIATITGIGGMAGGIGSFLINKGSGVLFDFAATNNWKFLGFQGVQSGYFIIFSVCAVAYLIGWIVMKLLVPVYKPVRLNEN
jgi:ACS family hexuronate transporter-like MFS transporter